MKRCLNCEIDFEPKKPKAKFCSASCRVKYHRALKMVNKDLLENLPTGNELREIHKNLLLVFRSPEFKEKQKKAIEDLFDFGVAKIEYRPTTEQCFDGEKQDKYVQDEPPQYQKPKALRSFNDLLAAAKSVTTRAEREAVAREASIHPKLTPGQKGMIQAKFPPLENLNP